jgi:hypothetical protein
MIDNVVLKLISVFQGGYINRGGEFIAHERANDYFNIAMCVDEEEVKCKVLEWFSRGAFKNQPYVTAKKNNEYHQFMLNGINGFLGTAFNESDIAIIYQHLGNNVNRMLCLEFVRSGYDISILEVHP